jgi:tRNA-Thr(GGU) m(6)t(6)A37 methyltransferase TsaA
MSVGYKKNHAKPKALVLRPIGVVRSPIREPGTKGRGEVVSEIHLHPKWIKALKGLEDFSHIIVLFWLSRVRGIELQTHPRNRKDLPRVGTFSTRSPFRPNPIGLTVCRLLKRTGTRLHVKGLDAVDGTPVVDIKPYISDNDLVHRPRMPSWVYKLRSAIPK